MPESPDLSGPSGPRTVLPGRPVPGRGRAGGRDRAGVRSRVRTAAALGLGGVLLAALAACGAGSDQSATVPGVHGSAPALWNPCDGLPLSQVEKIFAAQFTVATGTATQPVCNFTPTVKGTVALGANYLLFDGTIADLIDSFGDQTGRATIIKQGVPKSDGARLIVQVRQHTLLITGYVKDGQLMQTVNVADPAPYARKVLLAQTHRLLVLLSAHAVESGLTGPGADASAADSYSPPADSSPPTSPASPANPASPAAPDATGTP